MNTKHLTIVVACIAIIGIGVYVATLSDRSADTDQELDQQANQEPAQQVDIPDDWQTEEQDSLSFRYPETFGVEHVEPIDWPPQVREVNEPYTCDEAGVATDRAGQTVERIIGDHAYCVTSVMEGAAGSVYVQYAYITEREDRVLSLTFSTRSPRCENFGTDQEREQCESDQHLDLDEIVHQMIHSIEFQE